MSPSLPETVLGALLDAGRRSYEDAESRAATAMESVVASDLFGELLALATSNVAALTRAGNTALDAAVGTLRLATKVDLTRLAVQQNRTEDKLEALLQAVERLEDAVQEQAATRPATRTAARTGSGRTPRAAAP